MNNSLNNQQSKQFKTKKEPSPISTIEGAQIYGVELYQKLQNFLEKYLERLLRVWPFRTFESFFFE